MSTLRTPHNVEEYVRQAWQDMHHMLSPHDRAQALLVDVNEQLTAAGVPVIGWYFDSSQGHGAQFDRHHWSIALGDEFYHRDYDTLGDEDKSFMVNAIYHEARHAEQMFLMVRMFAGRGGHPDLVAANMGLPEQIAQYAAQQPLHATDPRTPEIESWYSSIYGDPHRHEAIEQARHGHTEAYRQLPEERDAWAAGDAAAAAWDDYAHHQRPH